MPALALTHDPVLLAVLKGNELVHDEDLGVVVRGEGPDVAQVAHVPVQRVRIAVVFLS